MKIRNATVEDAASILEIYTPYVETTSISFEEIVPTETEMAGRIQGYLASHAYLVAEDGEGIVGFAYGSTYRPRQAYRFTAEVSVYVADRAKGQGRASQLYKALLADLTQKGFHSYIAFITLPNDASERLHKKFGFTHIGTTPQVGRKFGKWHDIAIWQKTPPSPLRDAN